MKTLLRKATIIGSIGLSIACSEAGTFAQGPMALLKLPLPAADQTLHYGGDPLQFGELRLPKSAGLVPVVMIVHGGCWADRLPGLDPRLPTYELLKPLAAALASAGVATWNVEYRRAGSPGGGWPATYLDLAASADYLKKIAPANKLDLSRVVLVGHSSGGQFVLWLGARKMLPKTSEIYTSDPLALKEIIDVDGPPELASAEPVETQFCPIPGITQLMDGKPAERPTRYKEGSAESFLPLGVPQVIVSAALLQNTPELVSGYKNAAVAKGDAVSVLPLEKSGHFDMLDPSSAAGKALIAAILAATAAGK